MGYQAGKGLGKNLEGRSTIVEAFVRKGVDWEVPVSRGVKELKE